MTSQITEKEDNEIQQLLEKGYSEWEMPLICKSYFAEGIVGNTHVITIGNRIFFKESKT